MGRLESWWRGMRADPRRADVTYVSCMLALGVALVAMGLVDLWSVDGTHPFGLSRWWHLIPLVAIIGLALVRRSRPVMALVAGLLVFAADLAIGGSLGVIAVLFDLLFSVARHGSGRAVRWLIRIAVAFTAAVFVVVTVASGEARLAVFAALQAFAIVGAPVWWGVNVRQEAALTRAAEEVAELERERGQNLVRMARLREDEVVRAERSRMARDLHDVIASHVSTIAIHAEAALSRSPDAEADRAALTTTRAASVTALAEMRSMISLLRSEDADSIASAPGLDRIDELVSRSRSAGTRIDADVAVDGLGEFGAATEQAAYRIVQEALTNAAKHSSGTVTVGIERDGRDLMVEICSRGRSSTGPVSGPGGIGLVSMRERAEALGGTFHAGWAERPGDGIGDGSGDGVWAVRARLPVIGTAA